MIQVGDPLTITRAKRRWWQFWRWYEPRLDGTYRVESVSSSTIRLPGGDES